jgi:hypothetical protein
VGRDETSTGATRLLTNTNYVPLEKVPIINRWKGRWGWVNRPGDSVFGYELNGSGPPSPKYRGPAEKGGSILIQDDPKGFHNSFLKSTQGDITIP